MSAPDAREPPPTRLTPRNLAGALTVVAKSGVGDNERDDLLDGLEAEYKQAVVLNPPNASAICTSIAAGLRS